MTNLGRSHTFGNYRPEGTEVWQPPNRQGLEGQHAVLSLAVRVASPSWLFETLWSQSHDTPLEKPGRKAAVRVPKYLKFPALIPYPIELMFGSEGSHFTKCSLEEVRCIHVSTGAIDRSRSEFEISGLKFEYRRKGASVVVGQWMNEGRYFNFTRGEKIKEIWFNFAPRDPKFAKITGLTIITCRQTFKFLTRGTFMDVKVVYRSNPWEDLKCLAWSFNSLMDDVRVGFKPNEWLRNGQLLFCHDINRLRPPFDVETGRNRVYARIPKDGSASLPSRPLVAELKLEYFFETLFFTETDLQRQPMGVTSIQFSLGHSQRLGAVEFRYGQQKTIRGGTGIGPSDAHEMHLQPFELLSRLIVYKFHHEGVGIELRTTFDRRLRAINEGLSVSSIVCYDLIPGLPPPIVDMRVSTKPVRYQRYPLLNDNRWSTCCVGLSMLTRRETDRALQMVTDVGPVYLVRREPPPMQQEGNNLNDTNVTEE